MSVSGRATTPPQTFWDTQEPFQERAAQKHSSTAGSHEDFGAYDFWGPKRDGPWDKSLSSVELLISNGTYLT